MFRNLTPVVKNILLITVGIYFVTSYFMPELKAAFALYYVNSNRFIPTQFLTYMFMHADGWHLFSNMFGLFIFGPLLEQFLGPKKILILWIVCGVGSGLLYSGYTAYKMNRMDNKITAFHNNPSPEEFKNFANDYPIFFGPGLNTFYDIYNENPNDRNLVKKAKEHLLYVRNMTANIPMVGASGAVFGVLIAFGMLFPNTQLFLLFPPMPVKAKYLVLFYGLYSVYATFANNPTDNVAHFAHLSGLVVGAILVYYWKKDRSNFY